VHSKGGSPCKESIARICNAHAAALVGYAKLDSRGKQTYRYGECLLRFIPEGNRS